MNRLHFLLLFFVGSLLLACNPTVKQSIDQQDTVVYPDLVNLKLTGQVDLPDSTQVYINTDENTMQPLLSAHVVNGSFTLAGELAEPNFYNLVMQKQKFKVYIESDRDYHFEGNVSGGAVRSGSFRTNSVAQNNYQTMEKVLKQELATLQAKSAGLRSSFDNPETYQAAVEQYERLSKQRGNYPDQLRKRYLDDPAVAASFKIYLIKEAMIGKDNHDIYHQILTAMPDSLKRLSMYRQAMAKVEQVHDFFAKMPDFPDIHPRNIVGDSLNLADLSANGSLLFVFWGSWNKEAKADIQQLKNKSAALRKLGVQPIFLTWEKDFDAWEKASKALSLGKHNYRLNTADQEFMVTNYAVRKLPHYLLVNAKDLKLINYAFTYPLDGQLENKLKEELWK